MLWLWVLWGRNTIVIISMLALFLATELTTIAISVLAGLRLSRMFINELLSERTQLQLALVLVRFDARYHLCALSDRGFFPLMFLPGVSLHIKNSALRTPKSRPVYFRNHSFLHLLLESTLTVPEPFKGTI
jgi:hypothetical protein